MKSNFPCPRIFVCLVFFVSISPSQKRTDDTTTVASGEAEFQRHAIEWMNAYNSGEAVNLMPMYTPDANYISSHVPGLVARGREKVGENFQRGMSGGGHIDTIVVLGASVSCNLAYVRSRYEATNDGRKAVGQNMIVLKRISGKWLIKEHMTAVLE